MRPHNSKTDSGEIEGVQVLKRVNLVNLSTDDLFDNISVESAAATFFSGRTCDFIPILFLFSRENLIQFERKPLVLRDEVIKANALVR